MGTRHLVKIIKCGETVLNQYGQWDGRMDYAGVRIADFIRTSGIRGLEDIVDKTKVATKAPDDYHLLEAWFGFENGYESIKAIIDSAKLHVPSEVETPTEEMARRCAAVREAVKKHGLTLTAEYITRSRDTGYNILHFLKVLCEELPKGEKIPVYLSEVDDDAEMIYAVYTINLDEDTFNIDALGRHKTWNLETPPTEEELDKFQKK